MALILAAGLGITGIAVTAQAAGTNATDACKHETLHYFEERKGSTYYNGMEHVTTYRRGYKCANDKCDYTIMLCDDDRHESHDYELVYYHDGSVLNTCVYCHYTFTAYF